MSYSVNREVLFLGELFSIADERIPQTNRFKPYEGWPSIRCKCAEIFGFQANEMEVRAPLKERPIVQVSYRLRPYDEKLPQNKPEYWSEKLIAIFGKPESESKTESSSSGSVVYNAKWLIKNLSVVISVFGGIRDEGSGPCAATLYFDVTNEIELAKPFVEKQVELEKKIWGESPEIIEFKSYSLKQKTSPFMTGFAGETKGMSEDKATALRLAQKALYREALLETPQAVAMKLDDFSFAIWKCSSFDAHFLSNKWDTVQINTQLADKYYLLNMLPARGGGHMTLSVGELSVTDDHSSQNLQQAANAITAVTGIKVKKLEDHDC